MDDRKDEDGDLTTEQAEEAVQEGDNVTFDELTEMYPHLRGEQIDQELDKIHSDTGPPPEYEEPRMAARQGRKTFRTGPKGVLTDFNEAKLKLRARRHEESIARENKVYMKTDSTQQVRAFQLIDKPIQTKVTTARDEFFEDKKEKEKKNKEKDEDEDEDENEMEDDEAMLQYKLEKLQLLDAHEQRYGNMMEVNAWNFEAEVYKAPSNVLVVVNVFQDYLERCARMNYCLAEVAKAYPHVKFLRARSDRIGLDTYPEVGLPTLIVFKAGEQKHNFIACHELIGLPLTPTKVERFLIDNKVLSQIAYMPQKPIENDMVEDNNEEEQIISTTEKNFSTRNRITVQHNTSKNFKGSAKNDDSDSELDID